mmetsp:Transcript_727/g.1334  ORF Transcript_727/g.1334 Transcript_727/m.1334 type:complete len:671 (-) Transcript_727:95-2107(-)
MTVMMMPHRARWFGVAFCIMGISSWGTSDGFCSGFTSLSPLPLAPFEKRIVSSPQKVVGFGKRRIGVAVAGRREPGDDPVQFSGADYERQVHETVKALAETHAGVWNGKATSWSVDAHDVARGVIRRKYDVPYTTHVTLTSAQDLELTLDTHHEDLDSKLFSSQTHVASDRLLQQLSPGNNNRRKDEATECCIVETFSFEDKRKQQQNVPKEEQEASNDDSTASLLTSRQTWCNRLNDQTDVDSVDGSFSLEWSRDCADVDASATKQETLPKSLFGILNGVQVESVLQHCTVLSDTERVRTFLVYNDRQELDRIIVCEEQREASSSSLYTRNNNNNRLANAQDDDRGMNEEDMEGTADRIINKLFGDTITTPTSDKIETTNNGRAGIQISLDNKNILTREEEGTSQDEPDRLKQLSSALSAAAQPSDNDDGPVVERLVMTLMDLSNGIWLGDSVIRNHANVPSDPSDSLSSQQGFGKRSSDSNNQRAGFQTEKEEDNVTKSKKKKKTGGLLFGRWMTGVQKVAFRVSWNFGDTVRSTFTFGKSLGVTTVEQMPTGSIGRLVLDESMKRRIPKHQRMTYIDFDMGLTAGFVLGSVYIRAPKNLVFNPQSNRSLPFVTEVCIFQQSDVEDENDETQKRETSCHKLTRIYNHEGRLKQGISSFFSLQPLPDRD